MKQKQTSQMPHKPKKSMAMRILVLVMAVAIFAGFIILPLLRV